jgi:hypothetical protein
MPASRVSLVETGCVTGKAAYSFSSYSVRLCGFAMELSQLLPAVNGVLGQRRDEPSGGLGECCLLRRRVAVVVSARRGVSNREVRLLRCGDFAAEPPDWAAAQRCLAESDG